MRTRRRQIHASHPPKCLERVGEGRLATNRIACAVLVLILVFGPSAAALVTTVVSEAAHNQFVLAYRLLQRGQDEEAAEAFDEYLGSFPRDEKRGDALFYRALLAMWVGQRKLALEYLTNAPSPTLVPDQAVHVLRGQLHSDLGQYEEALQVLEPITLDALEPAVQASVLHLQSVAYRGAGNLPAAAAQLNAAAQLDGPLRPRAMLDHARVLAMMKQSTKAIEVLQQCVALKDPTVMAEAARIAGDLAYQVGRWQQAIHFYQMVLKRFQSSEHFLPAVRGVMWARFSAGQFGQVLKTLAQYESLLTEPVDRIEAWYLAGSAQQELGSHKKAVALFEAVLADAASSPFLAKLLYKLASSQFAQDQFDAMDSTLRRLETQRPQSPLRHDAAFLLAAADVARGRTVQAAARLTGVIDQGEQHPYYGQALLQRGQLYESNNRLTHALRDYETYAKITEPVAAGGFEIRLRITDLCSRLGLYEEALETADTLLSVTSDGSGKLPPLVEQEALYRSSLALIHLKRYDIAHQALERLLIRHPQNKYRFEARYYRALVLISLDRAELALEDLLFVAASTEFSQELRPHALRLAGMHLRRQNRDQATVVTLLQLEKIVGLSGLNSDERHWLGKHMAGLGKHRLALAYFRSLVVKPTILSRRDCAEVLYMVGLCRRAMGQLDAAIKVFDEVVALGGEFDLRARLELGRTLTDRNRFAEALDAYAGLVNVKPTRIAVEALLGRAETYRRLAEGRKHRTDPDGARHALRKASSSLDRLILLHSHPQLSPLPQRAHIELHQILLELGASAGSTRDLHINLEELVEKFPDGFYAQYARAMLLLLKGNRIEAIRVLTRLCSEQLDAVLRRHVDTQLKALENQP